MPEPPRYRFGPLERRGLLLGLRGSQLAVLGGTGAGSVLALHVLPGAVAGPLVGAGLVAALVCALLPVGGRPPADWLPLLAAYGLRRVAGRHRFHSRAHLAGHLVTVRPNGEVLEAVPPEDRPRRMRNLRILEADGGTGEPTGVIEDRRRHTYVGVLRVRGRGFNLLDEAGQAAAVQAWADILAGCARESSPVSRLQWIERTLPEDAGVREDFERRAVRDAPDPARRVYSAAVSRARGAGVRHECLVAVRVDAGRSWRRVRQAGQGSVARGASALLLRELAILADALESAGVAVEDVLDAHGVARTIRTAYEPETSASSAWPAQTTERLTLVEAGRRVVHATYHVREWPRIEVGPDFLAPLLLGTTGLRTVSMTMEPVPAARAARELRGALVSDASDDALREKGGWLPSFRRQREQENVLRAERELADGHATYRFSAYVMVSAGESEALESACADVEQAASRSQLELERLVAQQETAITYTLPLCEGLA